MQHSTLLQIRTACLKVQHGMLGSPLSMCREGAHLDPTWACEQAGVSSPVLGGGPLGIQEVGGQSLRTAKGFSTLPAQPKTGESTEPGNQIKLMK